MRKRTWRSALALLLVFALVFTSGLPAVAKTEENRADPTETAAVYLSDMEWTSAEDGWWQVRKDRDVNVHKIVLTDENGEEVSFEKGLGTSGNATIVYDLTGYGALRFQAQIAIQSDNWWGGTSFTLKKLHTEGGWRDVLYEEFDQQQRDYTGGCGNSRRHNRADDGKLRWF